MTRILIIDTDTAHVTTIKHYFEDEVKHFACLVIDSFERAEEVIIKEEIDVVLSCYRIRALTIQDLLSHSITVPVIVMGYAKEMKFIGLALEAGATDYVIRDSQFLYIKCLLHTVSNSFLVRQLQTYAGRESINEQEYADIVQTIPDIVYKINPEGIFTFVNKAIQLLNYEPKELIGKHYKTIIHPGDYKKISINEFDKKEESHKTETPDMMKCFDERRSGNRNTKDLEVRLIPKNWDGKSDHSSIIFGSIIAFGEISAQGQYEKIANKNIFVGTVGVIHNITERKKAEDIIRKLYEAVNQSPISILITDAIGTIEYANPHFFAKSGFPPEEILSKPITILNHEKTGNVQSEFIEAIQKKEEWQGELLSITKNGDYYWESVHLKPIINNESIVTDLLILKSDISEQKEMEKILKQINDELDKRVKHRTIELEVTNEELQREVKERARIEEVLRESEEKFRTFIETASDFMHMTNEKGYIIYANTSMIKALGYTKEQMIGRHISEVFSEETFKTFKPSLETLIKKGDSRLDAILLTRNNKKLFGEMIVVAVYNPAGEFTGTRGIFRNLTDRKKAEDESKKLEAQLQRVQKMKTISALAGGIAHDFNNILTPILGLSDLALLDMTESDKGYEEIKQITQAATKAKNLVKEILTFSKKVEQKRRIVEIYTIIDEVLNLIRATLPSTIEIKKQLEPGCGFIFASPSQIHQVIINICVNAEQAMENQIGVMEIIVKKTEFQGKTKIGNFDLEKGKYIELIIKDTGVGMDKKTMDRMFEPFFSTRDESEGIGLGLAVVHGIISNHHGAIKVESTIGKGTSFTIYLPQAKSTIENEEEGEQEIVFSTNHEHILLIDDDEQVAISGEQILETIGYTTITKTDPLEALDLFKKNPQQFDLVITDLTMPKMTGIQLAGEIKKLNKQIPIILATGYMNKINPDDCDKIGITSILIKPFSVQEMSVVIREILG
ncbi:MAG: PAS domain S-box protein [Spirochaetales bacterium]|nr:PAS domain S-box protein [Spirochaetales bacterium]